VQISGRKDLKVNKSTKIGNKKKISKKNAKQDGEGPSSTKNKTLPVRRKVHDVVNVLLHKILTY
jgi:hypothetical protein